MSPHEPSTPPNTLAPRLTATHQNHLTHRHPSHIYIGATERIAQKQVGTLGQLPEQLAAEAASLEHQLASSSGRSGHTHDLDGAGALADRLASAAAAGGPDGRAGGADGAAVTAGQRLLHHT